MMEADSDIAVMLTDELLRTKRIISALCRVIDDDPSNDVACAGFKRMTMRHAELARIFERLVANNEQPYVA